LVAKALGKDLHYQDAGTIQDAQSALIGVHRLDKSGSSVFDYAPFVSYIQSGNPILIDEINRAPQSVNNLLFPCLDKRRYLPLDIASESSERHVQVHKDTFFVATANLGAEYTGTSTLDRALLDRFFIVELDYPQEKFEIEIVRRRTGIDEKSATAIVKACNAIRKQAKSGEISNSVSVRHSLLAGGLVFDGFKVADAVFKTVGPLFEAAEGADERSKVKAAIAAF
jgi:MoxR-like ATPase